VPSEEREVINLIEYVIVGILVSIAMIYDIRQYRVPNPLIFSGLILGFAWQIFSHGIWGVKIWFVSGIVVWMILFPFVLLRMFGAGDVKLFMVIGVFLGIRLTIQCSIIALFIGAIVSFFKMCKHRILLDRLRFLASYFGIIFLGKKMIKYRADFSCENKDNVIPFVVPTWIAFLVSVIYRIIFEQDLYLI